MMEIEIIVAMCILSAMVGYGIRYLHEYRKNVLLNESIFKLNRVIESIESRQPTKKPDHEKS